MNLEHLYELIIRHCLHMSDVASTQAESMAYLDKAAELALKVQRMHEEAAKMATEQKEAEA